MLVNLIDDEADLLAGSRELLGKAEIHLGLHMVVVHHVEDEIGQMDCGLCGNAMRIIRGIDARRIEDDRARRQLDIRMAELDGGNRITVLAEALDLLVVIGRKVFARRSLAEMHERVFLARMDLDEICAGRDRA